MAPRVFWDEGPSCLSWAPRLPLGLRLQAPPPHLQRPRRAPLVIDIQQGDADLETVARDIFAFTKPNDNTCKLGEDQPVTVKFSDAVGEILIANQGVKVKQPNFKYYV